MEIESKPVDIDRLERRIAGLQVELASVARDQDKSSRERARNIREQVANLQEELNALSARWQLERQKIDEIATLKSRVDELSFAGEKAQREGDFEAASKIMYGELPQVRKQIETATKELAEIQ